jgi:hypothetical protein
MGPFYAAGVSFLSVLPGKIITRTEEMRKKQTFMLTIISPESETTALCGRLKVIESGKTCTFATIDELQSLIVSEMETGKIAESGSSYTAIIEAEQETGRHHLDLKAP